MTNPTAAALIIGNEILTGRTQDANLGAIGKRLLPLGIRLIEARTVPDILEPIISAINDLRARYNYVFTTGGIGPTHDDITAEAIARAHGLPLILHPEAHQRLLKHYGPEHLTEARLRMAKVPEGAVLIDNPSSAAPGFRLGNVYVLAGVPEIMQAMLDGISGTLRGGPPWLSRTINCRVAESLIANELAEVASAFPDCDIGSYPWFKPGQSGLLALVVRSTQEEALLNAARQLLAIVHRYDPDALISE